MSDDDDDPVVDEVDVFLSKQLAEHLLILQYPVRPSHISYHHSHHLTTRAKPKQQKLELELALNTHSPSYARSKGEQIALNVDTATKDEKSFFMTDKMDKQVLSSTTVGVNTGRYVIGTYRDKELHLTPLKGILQLRPNFAYLDRADSKVKDAADGEDSQEEEEDVKPVMVKFARQETAESKARRMASYEYLRKQQEEEQWVTVDYHQQDDPLAEAERCLLYSQQSNESSEFYMNEEEYLRRLIPKEEEAEDKKPAMPTNVLSMVELKTMAVADQVRALLVSAKVIRFSQLLSLLPKGTDATAVLRYVQQVALLVQGCWVVKSEVLYPKDSFSAHSGVPAETLGRGRDYIMWRFTQSRNLVRKDISSVIKLPAEDVKDILEQMARLKVNKGWEFLMGFDTEFVNRHVEVVQRQQMLWDRKFQQLSLSLSLTKADQKMAANAAAAATTLTSPKRRRTISRSRTKSGGELSMSDQSDMDAEPQKSDIQHRSSSHERRRNNSGQGSVHQQKPSSETNPTENGLMEVDSPSADHPSNGELHVKIEPALKMELIKFTSERLESRSALTLSEFRRLFNLKLAECPSGHILGTGVSDRLLEMSLKEVGARRVFPPGIPEAVYLHASSGDGLNGVRNIMFEMLQEKPQIKLNTLRKRIDAESVDLPTDGELRKLLKDYCLVKGGLWHLKGTQQDAS